MKIAAAQINTKAENIAWNLQEHFRMINTAAQYGVDLIIFPEMSITGYEIEKGASLAFTEKDPRLIKLRQLSVANKMTIIAGAPIKIKRKLYIGSFIIKPDQSVLVYTKQYLHESESLFYQSSFSYNPLIEIGQERISLAICADINNRKHPEVAAKGKTTLYLPSIFFSAKGIKEGHLLLSYYAKTFSMNILMANYCGTASGIKAGGQSAFWNKNGELVEALDSEHSGLLMITL